MASAIGTDGLFKPVAAYDTNGKGLAGNNTGTGAGPHVSQAPKLEMNLRVTPVHFANKDIWTTV